MTISRAEAIGQLLMIGFGEARWMSSCERLLKRCRPGGILFSARALDTPPSTVGLLRKIAIAAATSPFLALEEEGGGADPLRAFFPPLPSPATAAQKGIPVVARLGSLIGAALRLLGFNTNFAPTLDLGTPHPHSQFSTFGSDPAEIARCGAAFARGLRRHNILPCAKHFPGLSGPERDESKLEVVGKPMARLWREDLVPFRRLLRRLPMILVSRAAYKAYDFDLPRSAVLSAHVLTGLLRLKLRYRGLAMGEGLEDTAIRGPLDVGEAAVKAINAGCDVLLVRGEKNISAVFVALKQAAESGKLPASRLEEALARIRRAKKGLSLPTGRVPKSSFAQLVQQFGKFYADCEPQERKIA